MIKPEEWAEKGAEALENEDYHEAIRCFRHSVQAPDPVVEWWCGLGSAYLGLIPEDCFAPHARDPIEECRQSYAAAVEINPVLAAEHEAQYWIAELHLQCGEDEEARRWFSEFVELTNDEHSAEMLEILKRPPGKFRCSTPSGDIASMPIETLELRSRTLKALRHNGVATIEDLSKSELQLDGVALEELERIAADLGLTIR